MVCRDDDLCTLQELGDSAILSCLEDRYKKGIHYATVGHSVSLYLSDSIGEVQPQLDRIAAVVLSNLRSQKEDQCVLLCGLNVSCKSLVCNYVVTSTLSQLHNSQTGLIRHRLTEGSKLLSLLTGCGKDTACVLATTLFMEPSEMRLVGGQFSYMLMNTAVLGKLQLLGEIAAVSTCEESLVELGVPVLVRDNYLAIVRAIRCFANDLPLEGAQYLGVNPHRLQLVSAKVLAQQLYAYLVRWTVEWLNSDLCSTPAKACLRVMFVDHPGTWTDPYHNSLNDLVSRFSSEVIYNIYCYRLFVWEQEQYVDECIQWDTVSVEFNQSLINTFLSSKGLLFSAGLGVSDQISRAITECCDTSGDTCYETDSDTFVISHFNGDQSYLVTDDWYSLNSIHSVSKGLLDSLDKTDNGILLKVVKAMSLYSPDVPPAGYATTECTRLLTSRAKICMSALCEAVTQCNPHFVLCLDTHSGDEEMESKFDSAHVLPQLQHLRVLDMALLQSCGYPVRMPHKQFVKTYSPLLLDRVSSGDMTETCMALFQAAKLEDSLVGKTQVMLKPWHISQLEDALSVMHTSARRLHQAFRRSHSSRNSDKLKMASSVLIEPTIPEDSDNEDSTNALSSRDTSVPDDGSSRKLSETEQIKPLRVSGADSDSPNMPTPQPHPSDCTQTPLSPSTQNHNGHTTLTSPKSPRKCGFGREKQSWRKNTRSLSSSHLPLHPASPARRTSLSSCSWYHGKISRENSEDRLKSVNCDCFLIRESENRPGKFSLSLTHKGKVKHFRIDTKRGARRRFELFGVKRSFLQLGSLVEYYNQHCISAHGELLITPCPLEGTSRDCPPLLPPPRKTNLSSIKRPQQSIRKLHDRPRPVGGSIRSFSVGFTRPSSLSSSGRSQSLDLFTNELSDENLSFLQKDLDIEERIVEAARRLVEMPSSNKKEKQKRLQSLREARSRMLGLRQQYHTLQERRRFIELSMQNIARD